MTTEQGDRLRKRTRTEQPQAPRLAHSNDGVCHVPRSDHDRVVLNALGPACWRPLRSSLNDVDVAISVRKPDRVLPDFRQVCTKLKSITLSEYSNTKNRSQDESVSVDEAQSPSSGSHASVELNTLVQQRTHNSGTWMLQPCGTRILISEFRL